MNAIPLRRNSREISAIDFVGNIIIIHKNELESCGTDQPNQQ